METIWQCQLPHVEKPATLWLPTNPDLHPYMIICVDSGAKTMQNGGQFSYVAALYRIGQLKDII